MADRKIGSTVYSYKRLPADEGLKLLLRFLKIAGPAGGLVEALLSSDEAKRDAVALSSVKDWLVEFDPDAVYQFLMDVTRNARANGEPFIPGIVETGEFLGVAQFCIETELGGFFGDGQASAFIKPRPAAA